MKTNVVAKHMARTHEGALSPILNASARLRRMVMSCMLFEDTFYVDGKKIAEAITEEAKRVSFDEIAAIAIDAREKMKLRHAPLWLTLAAIRKGETGRKVGDLIATVIQRADEVAELVSMYWADQPNAPLTKQMKVGLARALKKFDAYQLAKYNRDAPVKLRDVLFLTHARPKSAASAVITRETRKGWTEGGVKVMPEWLTADEKLFYQLAEGTLAAPDTWEVALSGGADKRETFERLMADNKLGTMAFLRNLRGMVEAGVPSDKIKAYAATARVDRVLPFRFLSAAKYAKQFEPALEAMMYRSIARMERLPGKTAILVDDSSSMLSPVSAKSEVSRSEAAAMLAVLARELCDDVRVFAFATICREVAPRRGFALVDQVKGHVGAATYLGAAVKHVYREMPDCERLIVITDEQSADRPPVPKGKGYIINVGGYAQGIGYGPWVTIDGWSEAVFDFIREFERA